jgi:hypothetical protein
MRLHRIRSLNPIAEFVSDQQTIKTRPPAHKPADSGVAVGKGARLRSLKECLWVLLKRRCLKRRKHFAHTEPIVGASPLAKSPEQAPH